MLFLFAVILVVCIILFGIISILRGGRRGLRVRRRRPLIGSLFNWEIGTVAERPDMIVQERQRHHHHTTGNLHHPHHHSGSAGAERPAGSGGAERPSPRPSGSWGTQQHSHHHNSPGVSHHGGGFSGGGGHHGGGHHH